MNAAPFGRLGPYIVALQCSFHTVTDPDATTTITMPGWWCQPELPPCAKTTCWTRTLVASFVVSLTPSWWTCTGLSRPCCGQHRCGESRVRGRGVGRVGERCERHHSDRRANDVYAINLHVVLLPRRPRRRGVAWSHCLSLDVCYWQAAMNPVAKPVRMAMARRA